MLIKDCDSAESGGGWLVVLLGAVRDQCSEEMTLGNVAGTE